MKTTMLHTKRLVQALALAGLASAAAPASAMDVYLRAETVNVTMPDGAVVPMWGYALDGASCPAAPCAATVPGPALTVPVGDPILNVHLTNALTVPVSVVIPGQAAAMTPVKFTDASGRQRVRSLTAETAPGATATYSWSNLRPGTYLYHSGTHPQVQVQMGLYGTVTKDAAAGQPYTGVAAAAEKLLVFSEIDPAIHTAVTTPGGYGPGTAMPSTLNYQPKYFLINGKPHQTGDAPIPLQAGQRTLLRLVNAGIQTRVPVINGLDMELVAEDGNAYPWAKHQYSALLPALKTLDAVVTPQLPAGAAMANHPLYDRRLGLTNPGGTDNGMFAKLVVANGVSSPVITSTPVTAATVGSAYSYQLTASDPDGGALTFSLVSGPAGMTVGATGLITWMPDAVGNQSVTVRVTDPTGLYYDQVFTITTTTTNHAPATADDAASAPVRTAGVTYPAVAINVLANDSDPDAATDPTNTIDPATVWLTTTPDKGGTATVNADGSISYRPVAGFTGTETFRYKVKDTLGLASSPGAYVRVNVTAANQAPAAVDDTFTAPLRTATPYPAQVLNVLANDTDADGTIDPATVWITVAPNKGGWATVNADGTISYRPKAGFVGTETFRYKVKDNLGLATPTAAYVRINVVQ